MSPQDGEDIPPGIAASSPSWEDAWHEALYGRRGFYRRPEGPAGHFATAVHGATGRQLAAALWALADRLGLAGIVDVGAGRGELVRQLSQLRPRAPVVGVDVVAAPPDLRRPGQWVVAPGGAVLPERERLGQLRNRLVVAHEWLDVVPCPVVQTDAAGTVRRVRVEPDSGRQHRAEPVGEADGEWLRRWWPLGGPGRTAEVGRSRDAAWAELVSRVAVGAVLAIDYGHRREQRPATGTLAGYRDGQRVAPVPDGRCDLTAHVAVDSLAHDALLRQRDAVRQLLTSPRAERAIAAADPQRYLADLTGQAGFADLVAPGGFGDYWWVLACVQTDVPREWTRSTAR